MVQTMVPHVFEWDKESKIALTKIIQMKKYYIFSLFLIKLLSAVSCSDWTEPSTKNIDELLADADAAKQRHTGVSR